MAVVVKADLDTVKEFTGKGVTAKVGNKKHQCFFRVQVDDFNIEEALGMAKADSNILLLEYVGTNDYISRIADFRGAYIVKNYELGEQFDETDVERVLDSTPDGVTPVVVLPETYSNIRFVCNMLDKYKRLRFTGGNLFTFDEYAMGYCGRDVAKRRGIKFDEEDYHKTGETCCLLTFDAMSLDLVATSKSAARSNNTESKPKAQKTPKFGSLLIGGSVDL